MLARERRNPGTLDYIAGGNGLAYNVGVWAEARIPCLTQRYTFTPGRPFINPLISNPIRKKMW
jgi:hypothetical protein